MLTQEERSAGVKFAEWLSENGLKKIEEFAEAGVSVDKIAKEIGISRGSLFKFRKSHPEVDKAIDRGRQKRLDALEKVKEEEESCSETSEAGRRIIIEELDKADNLTAMKKKFVEALFQTGNEVKSAMIAGYEKPRARGPNLYQEPEIKEVIKNIQLRLAKLKEGKVAKPEEILEFFTQVMRGEIKDDTVVVEGFGTGVSKARVLGKAPAVRDRVKAGHYLGIGYGLFDQNVRLDVRTKKEVDNLSEAIMSFVKESKKNAKRKTT